VQPQQLPSVQGSCNEKGGELPLQDIGRRNIGLLCDHHLDRGVFGFQRCAVFQ